MAGFLGAPLETRGGRGADAPAGGVVAILVRQVTYEVIAARQVLFPKGVPRDEADSLAHALRHSTRCCHVLVGLGWGSESLPPGSLWHLLETGHQLGLLAPGHPLCGAIWGRP